MRPNVGMKRCSMFTFSQALKFYGCINVSVRDITIQDSPQMHLKFDNCQQVEVFNVSILSPGWSPNTDGIHLQNTGYALLQNLVIAAGISKFCLHFYILAREVAICNV